MISVAFHFVVCYDFYAPILNIKLTLFTWINTMDIKKFEKLEEIIKQGLD